jgi:23S rRNA pseudouridine2457 synthase
MFVLSTLKRQHFMQRKSLQRRIKTTTSTPPTGNPKHKANKPRPRGPSKLILLNKPYDVLCQFSRDGDRECLADYVKTPDVYPAGRLDRDSEGLLVLTNDGQLQAQISSPKFKKPKTYWAQVEGTPDSDALAALQNGVELKDGKTLPADARLIDQPVTLWDRNPPIRQRANQPTSWLELTIREGKNRQVRRMTAAIGHPTLRLIRYAVGEWTIDGLDSGANKEITQ